MTVLSPSPLDFVLVYLELNADDYSNSLSVFSSSSLRIALQQFMECFLSFSHAPPTTSILHRSVTHASKTNRNGWLRAKLHEDDDPLHRAATNMGMRKSLHPYCIATKFIDDKLLRTVNHIDGLKQVVLLLDGMDTRPYRLSWPTSTIIFDVSQKGYLKEQLKSLKGVGAKLPRSCLFLHVPLKSSNLQQSLRAKGFNGNQPSIWAIQGLPLMTLRSFEEILLVVSCLAMNGSFFVGELPSWLQNTDIGIKGNGWKSYSRAMGSGWTWLSIRVLQRV
ncbi:hypothetical protein FEM48_Zijuj07G0064200 [Ziziphus jujuba var. spinosa]|uniref:S-adenosyl-L-methionine-dependent methyltransferase n=1 Tax=Ziziphus jujuba var. spinosa TaxID=714518 RepID=A0A978V303_ZIZJJ|nr:hypothetical protein FEM48_Zijuj07G0064200 [Ziziphus jujuba var. spinosa]